MDRIETLRKLPKMNKLYISSRAFEYIDLFEKILMTGVESMITWEDLENKYGIRFKNNDGSFRAVNEWLDDLYLQCPSRCKEMLEEIFLNGDSLFQNILSHRD